ncbi:MAG: hypothetical protein GX896_04990, partial [Clostridiales bacterium]|nr:hypothetical protein [Clostridiales bacterium]
MNKLVKRLTSSVVALVLAVQLIAPYGYNFINIRPKNLVSAETISPDSSQEVTDTKDDEIIESGEAEYEDWTITGNEQLTSKKDVQNLIVKCGTLDLNEQSLIVHGDVLINDGTVRMNKGEIICNNFTMQRGNFYMNNVNDHIVVNKDFRYSGGNFYDSYITAGTIEIKGDFTSTNSYFRPTLEHRVILNGSEKQTISFSGFSSFFNILEICNTSSEGVYSSLPILANQIIGDLSKLSTEGNKYIGTTLTEDLTVEEDYYLVEGTLDLNGYTLTINGDFIHAGGDININGGTLNINGDFRIQSRTENDDSYTYNYSTGYLTMTNPDDSVNVTGDFVMGSTRDHINRLTAGTMSIKGNFEQKSYSSYNNFPASETHTVVFEGKKSHTINFASASGTSYSYFANLDLEGEEITVSNRAVVTGELKGETCQMTGYIDLVGSTKVIGKFNGNVRTGEHFSLNSDLYVKGNMYLNYDLNLNEKVLTVKGDLTVASYLTINNGTLNCNGNMDIIYYYGRINMQKSLDTIYLNGNLVYNGGYYTSTLTNGKFYIGGNCAFNNSGFPASGSHEVILNGTEKQTVSFFNAGSYLNKVTLNNTSEEGIYIATALNANETINQNGCKVTFADGGSLGFTLTEDKIIEGDYCLSMGTLDLNGHNLTINGDFIQSGGEVNINGGTLNVNGNYRIQTKNTAENGTISYSYSIGTLIMTNENDKVTVSGDFVMASIKSHIGLLTNGVLSVGGNFEQITNSSSSNFAANKNHTVVFMGKSQSINFASSSGTNYSYFANLYLEGEKITISNRAVVTGELKGETCQMTGYIDLVGSTKVIGEFNGNIRTGENHSLNSDIYVKGNLYLLNDLNLNGKVVTVEGDVTVTSYLTINNGTLNCNGNMEIIYYYGRINMQKSLDTIYLKGNLVYNGG